MRKQPVLCSLFLQLLLFFAFIIPGLTKECDGANCAPPEVKCAACEAMAEKLKEQITKLDATKAKELVGWRMGSSGKRVQKTITHSQSEDGIVKGMTKACFNIQNLTESTQGDGSKNLFQGPNDAFKLGGYKLDMYMRTCYDLIETHEEDFVSYIQGVSDWPPTLKELWQNLCTDAAHVCESLRWANKHDEFRV